jgi:ribosomal protein S18 acetylase RimI-like enzyme
VPDALLPARSREYFAVQAERRLDSTLVAVRDGEVVGLAIVDGDELWQLGVAESARGTGAAGTLMAAVEERIARGHERAWLAVVPGNARARAFYERCGWHDLGPLTYQAATLEGVPVPVRVHRYGKELVA